MLIPLSFARLGIMRGDLAARTSSVQYMLQIQYSAWASTPDLSECYSWHSTYGDLNIVFSPFDKVIAIHVLARPGILWWTWEERYKVYGIPQRSHIYKGLNYAFLPLQTIQIAVAGCRTDGVSTTTAHCCLGSTSSDSGLSVGWLLSSTGSYCHFVVGCIGSISRFS